MKNQITIIGLILLTVTFLSACGKKEESEKEKVPSTMDAIPVKIISLSKINPEGKIHASGQFTTDDETLLSFKTGGVVSKIYVKEGDRVEKGQMLASLALTEITAQVNQAQIAFDKATRDFKRAENLFKDSVASLEQFQNAKTGLEIAQQQLAAAKFNLSYSEIRATSDGVVLKKLANEGQIVGSGMPVIQTSSKGKCDWILRVALSDREWALSSLKDRAFVDIDALGIERVEGIVSAKSENADQLTGSFTVDIKLNSASKLNIATGMFGKAELEVSSKNSSVWNVPYEAVLDGNANEGFVFVTNDNKVALKVPVKLGAVEKDKMTIVSGLDNYKSLIVSGSAYLTDKSTIKVATN